MQGFCRSLNSQFSCIKCKATKQLKYIKWYKKSLNYNFKRSCKGWKDKNRDLVGLNFKRQYHWINMNSAHFKVKMWCWCFWCLWREPSVFSWHFHFILPIMPVKAAYMSAVLFCLQLLKYRRSRYLLIKRHLVTESEFTFTVCLSYVKINANIDPCFYAANIAVNVEWR